MGRQRSRSHCNPSLAVAVLAAIVLIQILTTKRRASIKRDTNDSASRERQQPDSVLRGAVARNVTHDMFNLDCVKARNDFLHFGIKGANFRSETVVNAFMRDKIPTYLIQQIADYDKKVIRKRMTESARLWSGYESLHAEHGGEAACLDYTPECAIFLRYIREVTSASDGWSPSRFLFVKCCVEHRQLRAALSCLHEEWGAVPLWITSGTLLGVVRGPFPVIIPWDTDVDMLVDARDADTVSSSLKRRSIGGRTRCAATFVDNERHAHGHLLGFVYGRERIVHPDDSRVEIWRRDDAKKMQRAGLNLPLRRGTLYNMSVWIPADSVGVLEAGYGSRWCWPCKHRTSNCKQWGLSIVNESKNASRFFLNS